MRWSSPTSTAGTAQLFSKAPRVWTLFSLTFFFFFPEISYFFHTASGSGLLSAFKSCLSKNSSSPILSLQLNPSIHWQAPTDMPDPGNKLEAHTSLPFPSWVITPTPTSEFPVSLSHEALTTLLWFLLKHLLGSVSILVPRLEHRPPEGRKCYLKLTFL